MIKVLRDAWSIPELRRKIMYTIIILILFRIGSAIPVPFLDSAALQSMLNMSADQSASSNAMAFLDLFTGGAFSQATIFAMSISPYINASIIMQLLTIAIPALERMVKEDGEKGRKFVASLTRYLTVVLGIIQGYGFYTLLAYRYNAVVNNSFFTGLVIVSCFSAGTALIMWLGEHINEKGIGNGISLILFTGIVSRGPALVSTVYQSFFVTPNVQSVLFGVVIIALALAAVAFVVVLNNAERRIPVQYAKKVVGRKMYGGQSTHIPLKLAMSGVMPIIFASSFLMMPSIIANFFDKVPGKGIGTWIVDNIFSYTSWPYAVLFLVLIIAFNFFYVFAQYDPMQISNNIKNNGGFIMGLRPGKPTTDFIRKTIIRLTVMGAAFLGIIAVLPIIIQWITKMPIALGGTSLLIIVGVALETVRTLESQMLMRHYKGFLE